GAAFFAEGGDAFPIVVRSSEFALQIALEVELLVEACAPALPHRRLDCGQSLRRSASEAFNQLVGFRLELIVFDDAPDQTPGFSFLRTERLAGQSEPESSRLPRKPRQN